MGASRTLGSTRGFLYGDERKKCASTCYSTTSLTSWSHQINQILLELDIHQQRYFKISSIHQQRYFKISSIHQWSRSSAFSPKWFKALRKLRTVSSCLDAGEWHEKIICLKTASNKTTPILGRHVVGPVTFAEKVIHHHLLSHTGGELLRRVGGSWWFRLANVWYFTTRIGICFKKPAWNSPQNIKLSVNHLVTWAMQKKT